MFLISKWLRQTNSPGSRLGGFYLRHLLLEVFLYGSTTMRDFGCFGCLFASFSANFSASVRAFFACFLAYAFFASFPASSAAAFASFSALKTT
jgi:hypothetical protein